jgi:Flp pilus assembly protein TadD
VRLGDAARKLRHTALILTASSGLLAQGTPTATLDALQQQVVTLCRSGHCEEAIPLYRQIAALQPDDPEALKDLMWSLWDSGRVRETIQVAEKATRRNPEDTEVLNVLGRAYLAANESDKALAIYKKLLALSPQSMPVWLGVSRMYADVKEYDDAERLLEDARQRFSGGSEIYPRLARVQYLKGEFSHAAKNWTKAVAAFPLRQDYRFEQARAIYYDGRFSRALAIMESLLNVPEQKRLALDFLTDDALARGDWDGAAAWLERGTQRACLGRSTAAAEAGRSLPQNGSHGGMYPGVRSGSGDQFKKWPCARLQSGVLDRIGQTP